MFVFSRKCSAADGAFCCTCKLLSLSRSRLPIDNVHLFIRVDRMERESSDKSGPWYGSSSRLRFVRGGLVSVAGGVGGRLRVAVASNNDIIRALWSCTAIRYLRVNFMKTSLTKCGCHENAFGCILEFLTRCFSRYKATEWVKVFLGLWAQIPCELAL